MNKVNCLYDDNIIDYKEYKMILDSYLGHLSYGNCNNLMFRNISCGKECVPLGENISLD